MSKKRKQRSTKPDEEFIHGPLRIARYGRHVVFESNWPDGAHTEMIEKAAGDHTEVVKEIDALVQAIAEMVRTLPPDQLLHRAWGEFSVRALKIEAEAEFTTEDAIALRMIDYIQSVIVSVKPAEQQKAELGDEDWKALRQKVEQLFRKLNFDYQICRTAKTKTEDPSYNDDVEEFYYKAQMYWCNVRGARYQNHEIPYLRDMFRPHSAILEELFGLTAEAFVGELAKIWHSLTYGMTDTLVEMESFRNDTLDALKAKLTAEVPESDTSFRELMQKVIVDNGWSERQELISSRFFGLKLFDVAKITSLPQALIDELSWGPGEESGFFADGEFRGWPLRIWPTFKRPFIRLGNRSYCFDLHSLFDGIYRIIQRLVLRLKPEYRETWNKLQQELSEELPIKYFQTLLPGATTHRSVYYRWHAEPGDSEKNWCETDGLLVYDDHLFIIEARAGAFTYTSPANDFPAFIASLRNLVLKPATQGRRFLDYLTSADKVELFDKDHKKVGELTKGTFRQIIICPVTLDPFTEMAAQVQHLRRVGIGVGSHPVWAISLDDLRVYADIFENPLLFLHYVDQRMRAFQSDLIQLDDELDHLGLYFEHNNYALYAEHLRGTSEAKMSFTGYRSEIDKFFRERLLEAATPPPLKQEMPGRLTEIVAFLSNSEKIGRAELSAYLLDLDDDTRKGICDAINTELLAQPTTKRPKPFSSYGEVAITVYCYTELWAHRDANKSLEHARSALLVGTEERRFLLELNYSDNGQLVDIHWQWVDRAGIPAHMLPRLQQTAETLRTTRVAKAKSDRRKIGRNEYCPCGSGKKYKKCCLGRYPQ